MNLLINVSTEYRAVTLRTALRAGSFTSMRGSGATLGKCMVQARGCTLACLRRDEENAAAHFERIFGKVRVPSGRSVVTWGSEPAIPSQNEWLRCSGNCMLSVEHYGLTLQTETFPM